MLRRLFPRAASQQASVASLGWAALLAFVGLVGFEGWQGYEHARLEVAADVAAHARLTGEHVERTFQTVDVVFDSIASEVEVRPWEEIESSRGFYEHLRRLSASLPQMRSIWLVDQNGRMRAYSGEWPTPTLDAFEREYYVVHAIEKETELFPGEPLDGAFTGRSFVPVSKPLVVNDYSFRGVVAAAIEPSYYLPIVSAQSGCTSCTTAVFRPDGEVLFSTSKTAALEPALVEGISTLIVSDAYPIVTAVWVPESAILALWWQHENGLLLAGLAALLLLTWLLLRAVRSSQAVARERDRLKDLADALARKNDELDDARSEAEAAQLLEQQLRMEAAAANRAKSQFLALMSHELRTPLNAIIGFSEMIRGQAVRVTPEKVTEYADDIHNSGTHLLSLINDILDLSKIEAGRFELEEENVSIKDIVLDVKRMIDGRFGDKRLRLAWDVPDVEVLADDRALKQILLNLLSNAGKFTDVGGAIDVCLTLEPEWLRLTIADDGCGMSEEDLKRALKPFSQALTPLARQSEGTGLGLNITEALVKLHGGRFEIESAPARGTTVTVLLPAWRLRSPAEVAAAG